MRENDFDYYSRRAEEEAAAALRASNPAAAKAHQKLVDQYATLAEAKRSLARVD
jgi:hypothetical protein